MRRLSVFNSISLDGYFTDAHGDMGWAHGSDPEFDAFTSENAQGGGELLFGRVTYELMNSFWPTPLAAQQMPDVAKQMNALPKVVFSRTMQKAEWSNTRLVNGDILAEVQAMKSRPGPDMLVMGSGTIVSQLTEAGLIDEFQVVLVPIVLGGGRTMFDGVKRRVALARKGARTFANGKVFLTYEPR